MTLNSLEVKKMLQKLIYYIFGFFLQNFIFFTFFILELFLDEHAMVLRYFKILMKVEWKGMLAWDNSLSPLYIDHAMSPTKVVHRR
jgi:hypothetical protein